MADDAFIGNLTSADKKLIGVTVKNPAGETLGTVDDLMIDPPSGQVIYAVLSFGGLLGLGKQYHPVPWSLVTYDSAQDVVVVEMTMERLEGAPNYGLDFEWTRRFASDVDAFYGIQRPPPTT